MLKIIEKTKLWFSASLIVILIGMGFIATKGLNFGIDFKGGTQLVIEMGKDFQKPEVDEIIKKYDTSALTNKIENTKIEIKSNSLTDENSKKMLEELKQKYNLNEKFIESQDYIGSSIGKESTNKAYIALLVAVAFMLLYVGLRFEFKFGAAAILALVHDVLITLSVYAIFQIPVNSPFIAAILTIIGYSINDTIVIFDRIRENQKNMRRKSIEEVANISITQTMRRSINTSLTTLITIVAVYIFVPTVRDFSFPLIIGIATGTYSSIFIASPIWVLLKKKNKKVNAKVA
ncbi:preprotein translocase subunit SecF [Clostridium amylolyticum]|uniref:Protein-export membrane protein SecF n=1 Tax=Clostridium amylolyticum TaxID=1121298 RepID=A0A1M6CVX8_9CLOT|nr:protein translocase subunit SecF [Clostridium amylolyticum]SHI65119.1 preprotein translocase subunit SecF [Clostridium amylolyticum]